MKTNKIVAVVSLLILAVGMHITAYADITNGGFETGDFSGWSPSGAAGPLQGVYSSFGFTLPGEVTPMEGNFFAVLTPDADAEDTTSPRSPQAAYLLQGLSLNQGDTISGWSAFKAGDEISFADDYAFVALKDQNSIALNTLWSRNVGSVGDYGYSGWEHWSFTVPTTGIFDLTLAVGNENDNQYSSFGFFDGMKVSAAPEPISSTLFLLGAGALALRRKRQK